METKNNNYLPNHSNCEYQDTECLPTQSNCVETYSKYFPLLTNWKSTNNVYLALGSNMGDSEAYLKESITLISKIDGVLISGVSSIYKTIPVGFVEQCDFLNMAIRIQTTLTSLELLHKLQNIENTLKRERITQWGPRTIDIDILLYKDIYSDSDTLTLPHPRMFERAFVLVPLADVYIEDETIKDIANQSHHSKDSILKLASSCEDFHGVKLFKNSVDWGFDTLNKCSSNKIYSDSSPLSINGKSLFNDNPPQIIGQEIILLQETPSTNDYARELAETGAKEGTLVLTIVQSMGRGRMGRTWQSQNSDGIWMSVILKPNFDSYKIPMITLLFAVSIAEVIHEFTKLNPKIKWPNDILINNKKVCGILSESNFTGSICNFVVAGIGINVNQESFCEDLKDIATSLRLSTNIIFQKDEILKRFLQVADKYYADFVNGDFEKIISIYRSYSSTIGSNIEILRNNLVIRCRALDISESGNLIVAHDDESIEEISSGEIFVKK